MLRPRLLVIAALAAGTATAFACVPDYSFEASGDGGLDATSVDATSGDAPAAPTRDATTDTSTGAEAAADASDGGGAPTDGATSDASLDSGGDASGEAGKDAGSDAAIEAGPSPVEGRVAVGAAPTQYFACSIRGGVVSCGGLNDGYELGHGADAGTNPTFGPVVDPDGGSFGGATRVHAGSEFACAQRGDRVFCWGTNDYSQLGWPTSGDPGGIASSPTPVTVLDSTGELQGVQTFAAAGFQACATVGDGGVVCWGSNVDDQLCMPNAGRVIDPATPIPALSGARNLSVAFGNVCAALEPDGRVVCCGTNDTRQLGQAPDASTCPDPKWPCGGPVQIPTVTGARQVATGDEHTCAVLDSGKIVCWGDDDSGQLGVDPSTITTMCSDKQDAAVACADTPPIEVTPPAGAFVQVAVSASTSCGLLTNGEVWCWGSNGAQQLGRGLGRTNGPYPTPGPVKTGPASVLRNVVGIMGHGLLFCAVTSNDDVYCWGGGGTGVFADGGIEVAFASKVPL